MRALPTFALCLMTLSAACMPYRAGSYKAGGQEFPERRATRGCVDVGLDVTTDGQAEGPVLVLYLGNRCREGVWVDIPAMEITAQVPGSAPFLVALRDPRTELKAAVLGGHEVVIVELEAEAPRETTTICANLRRLTRSSVDGPAQTLCSTVGDA